MTWDSLALLLSSWHYQHSCELEFQDAVQKVLDFRHVVHERERILGPRDRIDFLVEGGFGLELKVKGSLSGVTRQIHRYLQYPEVNGLVLLTTLHRHKNIPQEIKGKPVRVVVVSTL